MVKTLVVLVIVLVKVLLDLFMNTKAGFLLRAEGDNPAVVATLARDGGLVKIEGLIIANALVALSGAVMAQNPRVAKSRWAPAPSSLVWRRSSSAPTSSKTVEGEQFHRGHRGQHHPQGLRGAGAVHGPGAAGPQAGDGGAVPHHPCAGQSCAGRR